MWSVRRALIWALTLMICFVSATPAYASGHKPKAPPKKCKPWSEALREEIEKSQTCERQKAQEVREAINATRAEGSKALQAAQRQIDATDGALQEARRAAREREAAHAKALFDFSERYSARGVELGALRERERQQVSPLVWMGVGAGVTVVAVVVLRSVLGGL